MDGFLSFLADLLLLTAGLAVLILWIIILVGLVVEAIDFFKKNDEDEDFFDD